MYKLYGCGFKSRCSQSKIYLSISWRILNFAEKASKIELTLAISSWVSDGSSSEFNTFKNLSLTLLTNILGLVLDLQSFLTASASITELSSCDIFIRVCSYKNIQQSRVSVPNIIISLRITEVKIENTEFYINTIRCLLLKNLLT